MSARRCPFPLLIGCSVILFNSFEGIYWCSCPSTIAFCNSRPRVESTMKRGLSLTLQRLRHSLTTVNKKISRRCLIRGEVHTKFSLPGDHRQGFHLWYRTSEYEAVSWVALDRMVQTMKIDHPGPSMFESSCFCRPPTSP